MWALRGDRKGQYSTEEQNGPSDVEIVDYHWKESGDGPYTDSPWRDAAKAKLVNNMLAGINLVAACEAFVLGLKLGLEAQQLFDPVRASSGASWIFPDAASAAQYSKATAASQAS